MEPSRNEADLSRAQGAQVGSGNVQNIYFAPPPPPPPPTVPVVIDPVRPPRRRPLWPLWVIVALTVTGLLAWQVIVRVGAAVRDLDLPSRPGGGSDGQVIVEASGAAPWTVEGHGYRYTIESVAGTTHEWKFEPKRSLTITGYVTSTAKSDFASKQFQFVDQAGNVLESVPFEGGGATDPPYNQRVKLVSVVWDANPRATTLTVTIHDFYWPAGKDLILRNVPVR